MRIESELTPTSWRIAGSADMRSPIIFCWIVHASSLSRIETTHVYSTAPCPRNTHSHTSAPLNGTHARTGVAHRMGRVRETRQDDVARDDGSGITRQDISREDMRATTNEENVADTPAA